MMNTAAWCWVFKGDCAINIIKIQQKLTISIQAIFFIFISKSIFELGEKIHISNYFFSFSFYMWNLELKSFMFCQPSCQAVISSCSVSPLHKTYLKYSIKISKIGKYHKYNFFYSKATIYSIQKTSLYFSSRSFWMTIELLTSVLCVRQFTCINFGIVVSNQFSPTY